MLRDEVLLDNALTQIAQAKEMIRELDELLPDVPSHNFRERLVAYVEAHGQKDKVLLQKAQDLLQLYEEIFGVNDLVERTD